MPLKKYSIRTCHGNDPKSQLLPPPSLQAHCHIFIDLEGVGVGMDNFLAPLSWLERGKCLEIWCGRARGERHRDWYRLTAGLGKVGFVIRVIGTSISCSEAMRRSCGEAKLAVMESRSVILRADKAENEKRWKTKQTTAVRQEKLK